MSSPGPVLRGVVYSADGSSEIWQRALSRYAAGLRWEIWPALDRPEEVVAAALWLPPPGMLSTLPALRAVFSLGAGVDHLLALPDLPAALPVVRLADAGMAEQMIEYVLYGVLRFHRDFDRYQADQDLGRWAPSAVKRRHETRVGVLGLGALGSAVATALHRFGLPVAGWSRTQRTLADIETFSGPPGLVALARRSRVLVALLPLTPETRGVLGRPLFEQMPEGAALINCGRGELLVEADLLAALESGHLRGAMLDVLQQEPPPPAHPFWRHRAVCLTPHVAASTRVEEACEQIAQNLTRLIANEPLVGLVDRARGY
jgi:glyoxylate/hydroxypyruvate reductase A